MSKYSNLKFFDSNSDELNLNYDSTTQSWNGIVYLPEVSVGLYETLTIYILEEVRGELGETKYIKPITPTTSGVNDNLIINFEGGYDTSIESDGVNNDITMYTTTTVVDDNDIPELYIKYEESTIKTRSPQSIVTGTSGIFDTVLSSVQNEPIQINVALKSKLETYHKRTLSINEVDSSGTITHNVATIRIYGETVAEDERLEALISNIGMSLSPSDHFVFEDANLRESSPDWKLINRKRRELLLEASNIKPFIGTYKALLNAIKYFGYENITLKEYYLNINEQAENFGKLKAVAVPNQEVRGFLAAKSTMSGGVMPNSNLKKTSRFSLVYRLNNATGEYDEWDIPEVKEALEFSPDEVLIKLYGLKDRLQLTYVPMHAKIVDICGEGDYFAQFNINTWNNQQNIYSVNEGVEVGYELFPERPLFLEDLRKVSPLFTGVGQDFTQMANTYEIDAGPQSWWKMGEYEKLVPELYDPITGAFDSATKITDNIGSNNGIIRDMAFGIDSTFAVDHAAGAEVLYVEDASTWSNTHNITYTGATIEPGNLIAWSELDTSVLITGVSTNGAYTTASGANITLTGNLTDWPHKGSLKIGAETLGYSGIIGQVLTVNSCSTNGATIASGTAITSATVLYHPNSWVTHGLNCYYTHAGGIAGFGTNTAVPPVHLSGEVLDGPTGVLWKHVPNGTENKNAIARSTPIGIYPKNAALTVTDYTSPVSFTTTLNNGGAFSFLDTECTLTTVAGLRKAGIITISNGITIRYSGIAGNKLTGCVSSMTSGSIPDGSATLLQRGFWEIATLRSTTQTAILKGAKVSNSAFSNDSPPQTTSTKSLSFDAKTNYVSVPFVNDNIRPKNALTMNVWVKHDSWLPSNTTSYNANNATQHIISCFSAAGGFRLYWEGARIYATMSIRDDSALGNSYKGVGTGYNNFNATITGNQSTTAQAANAQGANALFWEAGNNDWYMLTVTFDGRYIKLYVNGELVDQPGVWVNGGVVGGPAISDLGSYGHEIYYDDDKPIDLHIGGEAKWDPGTTSTINDFLHWDGLIDDVSIWNTPLTSARIKELYKGVLPSKTGSLGDNPITDITSFYTNYVDSDLSTFSETDIPVGCPIVLRANSLLDKFDDCNFTWEDGEDEGELTTTWDKWWHRNVYEVQWRLIGPTVNGVKYDRSFRGNILDFYEIALTLPYVGKYDVELSFYDLYNVRSVKFEKETIEVNSKEIETYAITQHHVPKKDWNEYVIYDWDGVGSDWDTSNENEEEVEDFIGSYYLTLDRANYANSDADWRKSTIVRYVDTINFSATPPLTAGFADSTGPYIWKNLKKHTWHNGETMSWNTTRIGADMNPSFSFDITDTKKVGLALSYYAGNNIDISPVVTDITAPAYTAGTLGNVVMSDVLIGWPATGTVVVGGGAILTYTSILTSGDTLVVSVDNGVDILANTSCISVTALSTDTYTSTIAPANNADLANWDLIADELNALLGDTLPVYTTVATSVTVNNGVVSDCATEIASPSTTGDTLLYAKDASNYLATGVITYTNAVSASVSTTASHIENFTVQNFKDIFVTHVTVNGVYTTTSGANITLTGTLTSWPTAGTLIVGGETIIYSAISGQVLTVTSCTINNATIASGTACTSITGTAINPTTTTCGVYTSGALGNVTMSGASMNVGAGWPHAGAVTMTGGGTLRYTSRTATQLTVSYDSGITTTITSPTTTTVRVAANADKYVFVTNAAGWVPGNVGYTDTGGTVRTGTLVSVVNKTGTDTSGVVTNVVAPAYTAGTLGAVTMVGDMDAGDKWPQAGTVVIGSTTLTYSSRTGTVLTVTADNGTSIGSPANCVNVTGLGWELEFAAPYVITGIANGANITGVVLGIPVGTGCVSVIGYYEITVPGLPATNPPGTIETDPINGQSLGFASGGATLTLAGDLTAWPNTGTVVVGGYSIEYNDIAGQVLTVMSDNVDCSPVADGTNITYFKEKEYPQLSKYTFNAVKVDVNNDGILDTCDQMLAVANGADKMHDFNTIVITTGTGTLTKYNKLIPCNPTYDDVKIIKQHEIHNKLNHFTFSYDNTKVPGVAKQEWVLKNNSKNIDDIYYNNRWLPYVFDETGDYTLSLKITDVNGNEIKTTKNILTIK